MGDVKRFYAALIRNIDTNQVLLLAGDRIWITVNANGCVQGTRTNLTQFLSHLFAAFEYINGTGDVEGSMGVFRPKELRYIPG